MSHFYIHEAQVATVPCTVPQTLPRLQEAGGPFADAGVQFKEGGEEADRGNDGETTSKSGRAPAVSQNTG